MSKNPKRAKKENDAPQEITETEEKQDKSIKKGKKSTLKTILFIIWFLLIALLAAVFMYIYPKLKNMNNMNSMDEGSPEPTMNPSEVLMETEEAPTSLPTAVPTPEITPEPVLEMKNNEDYGITNIMLFGMDNRYKRTILGGRSDVNIILTIDTKNNEVRMTSIMRDTLIYIPSQKDYNRVNSAIVYEDGPEGAIAAIEDEFLIDIDHYIITSFRGMIEIIDSLGGVEVTLSQNEVWDMNGLIQEMNLLFGHSKNKNLVETRGTKTINGIQAVAYMRIRKTDGVFMRDSRQKEVLASAREKLKTMSLGDINTALETITDWVKTDLEPAEFVKLAMDLYGLRDGTYRAQRVPYDDLYESVRYNKMAVIQYDKEPTLWRMHNFIYEGIDPETPQ